MHIKELQQKTGVSQKMIQFYEEQQLIQATVLENGFHEYDEAQVSRLKEIKMLRTLDISFEDIQSYYMGFCNIDELMAKQQVHFQTEIDELQFKKGICYQLQQKGNLDEEQLDFLEAKKHPSWKTDFLELRMLYLAKDQKEKRLFQLVSIWLLAGMMIISALPSLLICSVIVVIASLLTMLSAWKPNFYMDIYLAVLCFLAMLEEMPMKLEQHYAHHGFMKRKILTGILFLLFFALGVMLLMAISALTNRVHF